MQYYWWELIKILAKEGSETFYMNIKPADPGGQFQLVAFWDGSKLVITVIIYIRWQQRERNFFI